MHTAGGADRYTPLKQKPTNRNWSESDGREDDIDLCVTE